MAIKQSLTFGDVTSSDYGIYIGGEGTFNAPKRSVEIISIPGRNGDFILDNGHFENVELTYTAISYEKDLLTFAQNLSDFRNALASQKGYQKLSDSFNPTEYRMAAFVGGVEIDPVKYNTAAEFKITFNCKPQRFLTSGETEISVSSGDTITNPTLFEARPMLEVEGYGDIDIEGQVITINNQPIGNVLLKNKQTNAYKITEIDTANLNVGDTITIEALTFHIQHYDTITIDLYEYSWDEGLSAQGKLNGKTFNLDVYWQTIPTLTKGTSFSQYWDVGSKIIDSTGYYEYVFKFTLSYDGDNEIRFFYDTVSYTHTGTKPAKYSMSRDIGNIYGESTLPTLGNPIYCDLDIGEAYKYVGTDIVSVNSGVVFPTELPTLKPGSNTITYDNTITDLDIIPRWWKV